MSADNTSIIVTFSEAVYNSTGASGALEASDFALSLCGGLATLSSATPTSISVSGNVYTLGLPLVGVPNGFEIISVLPSSSSAIYDASNNSALPPAYLSSGLVFDLNSKDCNSFSLTSTGTTLGTTWNDLSGNNNHFTTVGSPTYEPNNGIVFTTGQITSYVKKASFAHPTSAYSDEFWIKASSGSVGIKSYAVTDSNNNHSLLAAPNNISITQGPSGSTTNSNINISDGSFHHVVRTSDRSSGQEKIYLDGNLAYTLNSYQAGVNIIQGGTIMFAQEQDAVGGGLASNQAMSGYIPIARMYNKVLTSSEVTQNYNYISQYNSNVNRVKLGPLTLYSSSPATASNTVSLDSDITLTFDNPIKTSTLNATNIVITGINTGIISGTFSGGGTTSVVFNPTTNFKPGEVITVTLTSALKNTSDGPLSTPQTFSFTTRNASTVSPTFTAADIDTSADGATSVFAADMDGDGDMDILSASQSDNTIAWLENDGNVNPTWTAADIATSAY